MVSSCHHSVYLDTNLMCVIVQPPQRDARATRAIVLYGMSGSGKTKRALAEGARPLLASTVDDLRKIRRDG